MKINKLQDIDLSKYKLAYYKWDSLSHSTLCQDDVMALTEWGKDRSDWRDISSLYIALIPKDAKLTECSWDDWDDAPAEHNAWWFYQHPEWTIMLQGILWWELKVVDKL